MDSSDFKLLDRKAAEAIRKCGDFSFFFRATSKWVGFKQTDLQFEVKDRYRGESQWSYFGLTVYALNAILLYSYIPLYTLLIIGAATFALGGVLGVKLLFQYFFLEVSSGYPTILVMLLLSLSVIVTCCGILGLYLQKILDQVKGRPRFIINNCAGTDESLKSSS